MAVERQDNLIQSTGQNLIKFVDGQVYPMIGYSSLGKIIGSNPFTAVTAAHLVLTILGNLIMSLLLKFVKQPGTHDLQSFGLVLVL